MQGRPSSSARPSTSARPTTAFDRDQFQQHQQRLQQQQPYEMEEEYEESDDEDVFAFLPPTTPDPERQTTSFAFANHVQYPEPTFDPWGRQYPISSPIHAAAFSTAIDPSTYPSSHYVAAVPPDPSSTHSQPYPHILSPPSPSTDSHPSTGMSGPNLYRLQRLGTAASSKLGVVDDVEKEAKGDESEKKEDSDDSAGPSYSHSYSQSYSQTCHQPLQADSSLADSLSMTQGVVEDDESRSIK